MKPAYRWVIGSPVDVNGEARCLWPDFCLDGATVNLAADLLLPSAAIIISTVVAVLILRSQLSAQRRERLAALIGRAVESLAEVEAEGELRRLSKPHALEKAVIRAEAGLFTLAHSLKGRDRYVPSVIRDEMMHTFLNASTDIQFLAGIQKTRTIFEDWTLGRVPRKYIIEVGRWRGGSISSNRRGLDEVKTVLETIHRDQGGSRVTRRTPIELLEGVPNMRRISRLSRPRPIGLSQYLVALWYEREARRRGGR